jgi:serine/threonine-protein kinase
MQMSIQESFPPCAVLSPQGLPPGTRVGRWRVERRLGGGGNGTVYEACRRPSGPRYALKLAHAPEDPRFSRESVSLSRVRHPGVVRLVEEGVWRVGPVRYPYLVLEYVRGESLYDWAKARNPTARQVAGLLEQAARALAEAHRWGVLHRDFKGENTRVGADGRLTVLDWGAGWYEGATPLTATARLPPGTPPYHSPQAVLFSVQAGRGRASGPYRYTVADELYAVGVTFYRVLVEEYPPMRLSESPEASVEAPGPWAVGLLNPRVPAPLAGLVHRLVAFQPEARPGSARALAEAVRRALAGAGPEWDEPLFEWYPGPAPDTRTTCEGAPPGPVAPGQEVALRLARMRHLDGVQRHREARRVRRREQAEVLTLPGAGSSGPARGFPRWRLAWAAGALAVVAVLGWALAHPGPPSPLGLPGGLPRGQQLARPGGPPDTAAPTAASHFFPIPPPWPEDAMLTAQPRSASPTRLHRYVLAASAAVSLTACPAAQVRPDAARCPSEALEAMRELKLVLGIPVEIWLDSNNPEGSEEDGELLGNVVVNDGPITSLVREDEERLPVGTQLHGRLWTSGEKVIGRWTRARTPDGREYPVCLNLASTGKLPSSRPGYTLKNAAQRAIPVDRFP